MQQDGPFKHVKGRFVYSPGLGRHLSILQVGPQILRCEFIPDEPDNFNPASSQVNIEITKTKPELVWDKKVRMLRYGTPLNRESHLNARYVDPFVTADFSYDKSPGQILDVGHWRISLIARPHDKSSYYPDHKVKVEMATNSSSFLKIYLELQGYRRSGGEGHPRDRVVAAG